MDKYLVVARNENNTHGLHGLPGGTAELGTVALPDHHNTVYF